MIESFNIYDHLWGVCNINRFAGKADRQITVGHHLWHCLELANINGADNDFLLYCLVHDLPEAYYGDSPAYIKRDTTPEFSLYLDSIDKVIYPQLGISDEYRIINHAEFKKIDDNALHLEARFAFDAYEPYYWPPTTIYDEIDVIQDIYGCHPVSVYNYLLDTLVTFGETNEALRNTLHRHQPRSHPKRLGQ